MALRDRGRAVRVQLNPSAVAELFRSESGPVMRYTAEVATQVQSGAKQKVGVGDSPERQGKHLRDSIVKRFVSTPSGPAIAVGSEEPHALLHHTGTVPHVIEPRTAKVLAFTPRGSGITVFTTRVQHPGTQPVEYLTEPARSLGLRVVEH